MSLTEADFTLAAGEDLPVAYFVSYACSLDNEPAFGNIRITLDRPITGPGVLEYVAEEIKRVASVARPIILFWRRFEKAI